MKMAGQDEARMHDFLIVGTGFNVDPALIPNSRATPPTSRPGTIAISPRLIFAAAIWSDFPIWVPVSN